MSFIRRANVEFTLYDVDINDYSDEEIVKHFEHNQYDVVLAGSIVTHYKWMKWLTNLVRRTQPNATIIIGNSVSGSIPETFLTHSDADIAIIGEGEVTTLNVLTALENNISLGDVDGIAYKDVDGLVKITPRHKATTKLDDYPIVDWSPFNVEAYFDKSYAGSSGLVYDDHSRPRVMPVVTARGCVFRCTFCHFVTWDDPYRYRSPQNILEEIDRNITHYGADYIALWDDLSFGSLKQAERLADAIIASGLKFNWNAAVRVDLFGDPRKDYGYRRAVAEKFREAGCLDLGFSLESADPGILKMMNKKITPDHFVNQVKILREVGIATSVSVVFGYPIETSKTIEKTFNMCLDGGVYPSIGFLLPLPYTGMWDYAVEHGYITNPDIFLDSITERQDICLNMTTMTDREMMDCISAGATRLNERLELNLDNDSLIRTGGYRNQNKDTSDKKLDPDNLTRIANDISFNYSQANFEDNLGLKENQQ